MHELTGTKAFIPLFQWPIEGRLPAFELRRYLIRMAAYICPHLSTDKMEAYSLIQGIEPANNMGWLYASKNIGMTGRCGMEHGATTYEFLSTSYEKVTGNITVGRNSDESSFDKASSTMYCIWFREVMMRHAFARWKPYCAFVGAPSFCSW